MPKLSPAMIEELVRVAHAAAQAPHGGKEAVYAAAVARLGVSRAKLLRDLAQVSLRPQRKRRADAGQVELPRPEAEVLSAYLSRHFRGNGKQSITLARAVTDLRANGLISATRTDPATGEIAPLSTSAIARALRVYGLHPEQLRRPAPAQQQSSPHPNHTWQMDASVCTLFYLADDGATDMPAQVFYKNKPENFERVAKQRVTRFVITCHTSGLVVVRYFLGGESIANFTEFFLWAITKHGVPFNLMVDPGSGMAGAFKNLVRRLRIRLIVNAPGNLRTLFVAFNSAFKAGLGQAASQYGQIATTVPSSTAAEEYGWLGQLPNLREWLGDRVVHAIANHGYTVKNKSFELTVGVPREAIEDDNYGVYSPLMTELGRAAAAHPDQLVFGLLKSGFTDLCYDGRPFFSAAHKVLNEKGKEVNQSNGLSGGTGATWYLMDTTRALKPLIYQTRKADNFVAKTAETDDNVVFGKQFIYGVDARRNAGFGFWQLAYASNEALTPDSLKAAMTAMRTRTGDGGRPLGRR